MHPIHEDSALGVFGVLFTRLRLWQYGIDTGVYLHDSGTDLVAVGPNADKPIGIQVKASSTFPTSAQLEKLHPDRCPLLAWVSLAGDSSNASRYFMLHDLAEVRLHLVGHDHVLEARRSPLAFELKPDNLTTFRRYFGEAARPTVDV